MKAFRCSSCAVLVAAALLSACTANGPTNGDQTATAQPTPVPTAEPTVEPSPTRTSSPSISPTPGAGSPGQATSSPTADRLCDTEVQSASPVLRSVRFGRHQTFDRLAFDFCKPAETTLSAKLVKQLVEDGSGKKVTLKGKYFYEITLTPADAHSDTGQPTVPRQAVTVPGRNMQQYKLIGDFEGVVTYGVGILRLEPTATALQEDPNDPRHVVFYFDLGPQRS